jgi:hypothetical protein
MFHFFFLKKNHFRAYNAPPSRALVITVTSAFNEMTLTNIDVYISTDRHLELRLKYFSVADRL